MLMILLRTLIVYLSVIITMRLLGKRQMSELQPSELVTAILISNLASISIDDPAAPLLAGIAPMFLITSVELLFSAICFKSTRALRMLTGTPVIVVWNGEPDQEALRRLRFTMEDLTAALREKDIFDLHKVACAIVETNGALSVCLRCGDAYQVEHPPLPLVLDGHILHENMIRCGYTEMQLEMTLNKQHLPLQEVLAFFAEGNGAHWIIKKVCPEKADRKGADFK